MRNLGTVIFPGAVAGIVALAAVACSSKSNAAAGPGDGSVGVQCDSLGATFCAQEAANCVLLALPADVTDGGTEAGTEAGVVGGVEAGADAGAEGGADGGSAVTMIAVCTELAQAFCRRETTCTTATTFATCESGFLTSCCGSDGTCGQGVLGSAATLQACITAIGQDACADIVSENLPTQCNSVIAPWTNVTGCESQWHDACCGESGLCSSTSKTPQSSIDACNQGLSTRMCGAAAPAACLGVISSAAAEGVEPVVVGTAESRAATRFAARVRATAASFVLRSP